MPGKISANLIPDPERAALVQKAFELFSTGAESKANVLRTVNALGLKTLKGRSITPQTFERLLQNPMYKGWIEIPAWGVKERGSFEALVSEGLFNRVQDILSGKRISVVTHQRNHPDLAVPCFRLSILLPRCQFAGQTIAECNSRPFL
jgi:site-specific DNA recombinase